MKILLASSEVVPFAKTGGLADVCGALPIELARLGHDLTVIMPAYRCVLEGNWPVETTGIRLDIPIGTRSVAGTLLRTNLPHSDVPVYLVAQDDYFDREGIYGVGDKGYEDNCERFVFFCRAVLDAIRALDLAVDLVHLNDWPTGLIPALLKIEYAGVPGYEQIASLLTIHNLAYQGTFWHWDMLLTGIDWKYFNWHQMEFHGDLNLLKTGLVFADSLNTVSPTYAGEIQSAPLGCGLEGVLSYRRDVLSGIINGVDYQQWNPAIDPHLAANYDVDSFTEGKAACKNALQQELGLRVQPDRPLVGLVGRMTGQKGFDLIIPVMNQWAGRDSVQWAILGTGDNRLQKQLTALASQHPGRVSVHVGFSDQLAHRIEAGADIFLMPSRYEPCGLNQLYSLKYGTVPVVHRTGGLADSVTDTTEGTLRAGTATGFSFDDYRQDVLSDTLRRACQVYHENPAGWGQIIATGMRQDWSWSRSAQRYAELYRQTVARRKSALVSG